MNDCPFSDLKTIFADIIRGYSILQSKSLGQLYSKHLDSFILAEINFSYDAEFNKCIESGIHTELERLNSLIQSNDWSDKKEKEISKKKDQIASMRRSKEKQIKVSVKQTIKENIQKEEKLLYEILSERYSLIGDTAESIATKKYNQQCLISCVFKDKNFDSPYLTEEIVEDISDQDFQELLNVYTLDTNRFSDLNLRKLAISPFFMNMIYLCSEESLARDFFGKPVAVMSMNQIQLLHHGRIFKNVYSQMGNMIPDNIKDDPEKILDWYEARENYKKIEEKSKLKDGAASSVVGATKEDLLALGIDSGSKTPNKELSTAAKSKKSMGMKDMMKMLGTK